MTNTVGSVGWARARAKARGEGIDHNRTSMRICMIWAPESIVWLNVSFYVIIYYEYHYSPHKLDFRNIMQAGDQKLMIDLEWPNVHFLPVTATFVLQSNLEALLSSR